MGRKAPTQVGDTGCFLGPLTSLRRALSRHRHAAQHPLPLTRKDLTRVSSFPAVDRRPAPRAVPSSERTKHQPGQPPVRPLDGASQLLQASMRAWCVPDFHPDGT